MQQQQYYDAEAASYHEDNMLMDDKVEEQIRRGFIQKIYGILSIQLLITVGIAGPLVVFDAPMQFIEANPWLVYLTMAVYFTTFIILACCSGVARSFPANYICLFIFTGCMGLLVGVTSSYYTQASVLLAFIATAGITIGMTMLAFFTKIDFTKYGAYLAAALLGLMVMGLILMITSWFTAFKNLQFAYKIYAALGAILFSFYIVYDTQLIVGGKHHQHQFSVDDYVFAALNIYLDIINLFIYLLRLFGERR
mmetsp:Transcript_44454/g.87856  ORF Transcript_44454/g.87856 Transcript_44454/m.87856 type:complete len:252 (+) Transcript_44454:197-952(+)